MEEPIEQNRECVTRGDVINGLATLLRNRHEADLTVAKMDFSALIAMLRKFFGW